VTPDQSEMRRGQKQISPSYLGLVVFACQTPTKINQSRLKINRGSRIVYSVETGSTSKWLGQQASGWVNKQVVGSVDIAEIMHFGALAFLREPSPKLGPNL